MPFLDIQIQSQDVFGNIFQNISVFDPVILQATLLNPDNYSTLIGETVKGILNQNTYTVLFNGLAIKSLRGQEVVQFSLLTTQQNLGYLQYNLTFNLPVCSNTTSILVASGEDSIGRTIYQCLPALAVDSNIRIGFAVFSIILIFISGGFGAFAHFNSNFRIYKSAAPIFTNLITFGCLLQLSSIIPQITANFVQCMLREWFEFIGFVFVLGSLVLKVKKRMSSGEAFFYSKGIPLHFLLDGSYLQYLYKRSKGQKSLESESIDTSINARDCHHCFSCSVVRVDAIPRPQYSRQSSEWVDPDRCMLERQGPRRIFPNSIGYYAYSN